MGFLSTARGFAPSKRVGAVMIVVCATIIAVVVFRSNPSHNPNTPNVRLASQTTPSTNSPETDTDGDGVPDWKEALWGLNPNNPDSNNDGIGDKDEVAQQEASRAQQQQELVSTATVGSTTDENLTKTDELTRALVEQAVAFDTAGISLDQNTSFTLADSFIKSVSLNTSVAPPQITLSALTVVDDSPASVHSYGNALGTILGGKPSDETSELIVLSEFSQTGDENVLKKLSTVKQSYETIAQQLIRTPVPQGNATTHLALVNAFLATGSSVESLGAIANDPLNSILGMRIYRSYSQQLSTSFLATQTYLKSHTTFENTEPGYIMIINEPTPQP